MRTSLKHQVCFNTCRGYIVASKCFQVLRLVVSKLCAHSLITELSSRGKNTFYFTSIERCSVVIIVIACSQGFRGLEFKTKQIILWNVVKDQEVR